MVRKIRYKQVLRHRCTQYGKGTYAQQVELQKSFWKEDNAPAPTIEQVRNIHSSIGTWDKNVEWRSYDWMKGSKGCFNRLILRSGRRIYPKSNYKTLNKVRAYLAKKARWKEQEQRTLEFLEREGC